MLNVCPYQSVDFNASNQHFSVFEEDLSFFNAFYFTFITMLTIGFGDIVPGIENIFSQTLSFISKLEIYSEISFSDIVGGENTSQTVQCTKNLFLISTSENAQNKVYT